MAEPTPKSDPRADTLRALTDFCGRLGPAAGERWDGNYLVDDELPKSVVKDRDAALSACFKAVRRIADATATTPERPDRDE